MMTDQFSLFSQEFTPPLSLNHATPNLPIQVKVHHLANSNAMEHKNMDQTISVPNSKCDQSLEHEHPQDNHENTKMIQNLINTIKHDTKKKTRPTKYSEASISQQDDRHNSRNSYY